VSTSRAHLCVRSKSRYVVNGVRRPELHRYIDARLQACEIGNSKTSDIVYVYKLDLHQWGRVSNHRHSLKTHLLQFLARNTDERDHTRKFILFAPGAEMNFVTCQTFRPFQSRSCIESLQGFGERRQANTVMTFRRFDCSNQGPHSL
jgi:hypothetical protein